jgi:deoxyribose-phosphate aldolase
VELAEIKLAKTDVRVCTVIGFPLGTASTQTKVFEAKTALELGADELDMVINIGWLKESRLDRIRNEIEGITDAAREASLSGGGKKTVKAIIETCLLSDMEKVRACKIAELAGADFVKTSTGFGCGGATVHDVKLMRRTVGKRLGVKASGGIKTLKTALAMLEAGANRIGTSSGMEIVESIKE